MMKNVLLALCVMVFTTSCLKDNKDNTCPYQEGTTVAPQAEQDTIAAYLDSNDIVATKHPSGFYYEIINPGTTSDVMGMCTLVHINYKGRLLHATTNFDEETDVYFDLGALVEGMRRGIPLIGASGDIRLYIPPSMGYGNNDFKNASGVVIIPGKSTLVFQVQLTGYTLYNN